MIFTDWLRRLFTQRAREERVEELSANVEDAGEETGDPFDPFPEPVRLEIRDVIDLHSIPPREVRAVVEEYLYQAHRAGFASVRIIHGKGVGVQREIVRGVLSRTPFVAHYADAPPEAGGWGATLARLHPRTEDEEELDDDEVDDGRDGA
ncbi:MAG TPA: Smr/MutS family protein [Pyrinomonadaceae bacterium]|nr:Smr/MutS family protein [Pyrinomonadaceae bacterium]